MSAVTKIKPEELTTLQSLQQAYSDITAKFGQIKEERLMIQTQDERLVALEDSLETQFKDNQAKESEFLKSLESTYGKVSVNIETGEITTL